MSDRGKYTVCISVSVQREVVVLADDFDEAEQAAMREVVNLVGGTNPRVVSAMEGTTDWPMDRADDQRRNDMPKRTDEEYCECPFCGIGYHCDEGNDGSDCPECGEWNGTIMLYKENDYA